jgi:hypothetical protein
MKLIYPEGDVTVHKYGDSMRGLTNSKKQRAHSVELSRKELVALLNDSAYIHSLHQSMLDKPKTYSEGQIKSLIDSLERLDAGVLDDFTR